jgi:hypothetical protein
MYDQGSYTKSSYSRQLDVNTFQFPDIQQHRKLPTPTSASTEADQKFWWDKILRVHTYVVKVFGIPNVVFIPSTHSRLNHLVTELTFL